MRLTGVLIARRRAASLSISHSARPRDLPKNTCVACHTLSRTDSDSRLTATRARIECRTLAARLARVLNLLAHASKQNYRTLPEVLLADGDDASSFVDITGTGNSMLAARFRSARFPSVQCFEDCWREVSKRASSP